MMVVVAQRLMLFQWLWDNIAHSLFKNVLKPSAFIYGDVAHSRSVAVVYSMNPFC